MIDIKKHFLFRLLNIWFGFVALLLLTSHLPHWNNTTFQLWFNEAAYFFLFLLSLGLAMKDRHNRDIFINLSVFFLFHALSFLNIFLGNDYILGNGFTQWYFYFYKKMALCFVFNMAIIYIVLKYLFPGKRIWIYYCLTLVILLPLFFMNFGPYIKDINYGLRIDNVDADLFKRILYTNSLSFVLIIAYGVVLYKTDRILGSSMDWLMGAFFIFMATRLVDNYSLAYHFQDFNISGYILMANLIFVSIILFRKLLFHFTDFGLFYEELIHKKLKTGKIQFQRYKGASNFFMLRIIKIYIRQRQKYLVVLGFLTAIGLSYFRFPRFFTLNVIIILGCSILLFWFISILMKKRAKKEFVIH